MFCRGCPFPPWVSSRVLACICFPGLSALHSGILFSNPCRPSPAWCVFLLSFSLPTEFDISCAHSSKLTAVIHISFRLSLIYFLDYSWLVLVAFRNCFWPALILWQAISTSPSIRSTFQTMIVFNTGMQLIDCVFPAR